jgi:hypothetical protein
MKQLFTLFLTCVISLSLMGQQDVIELQKQRYAKKHNNSFKSLESKMFKKPDHASRHLSRQFSSIQRTSMKADQAADQTMDSILWELYDTNTSIWVLSERELFAYDGNGNMINYVWFEYDSVDMKILPVDKETVNHNAQGQPTEIIWLTWDKASGQWVNEAKFELTYDGEGNLIQETVYDWEPVGSQWLVGARFDMNYDGGGNLLSEWWLFWDEDSSKLIQSFKDEYIYEGGKLTTMNEYVWEEGNWELFYITTLTYSGDNLIQELTQGWNFLTEDWVDFSKIAYTYVGDKVVTEEVWEFDWMQFMMVRQSYFEYTWDADGNMITEVESSWDEGAGAVKSLNDVADWQNTWKSEWAFNKNFTIFNIYAPYWFVADVTDINFVHMPVSETGYYNNNGTWDLNYRQTAYYSDFGGGGPSEIEDVHETPVSVFPIPASETVTFSWDEGYTRLDLEIYDLTGKQIQSRTIEQNETIRVDDLSRGLYLYKLSNNNHLIDAGKISLR